MHNTSAPSLGTLPPLNPVPEPRVMIGVFSSAAARTTAAVSSALFGNATTPGSVWSVAVPS